jgi:uncharacterized BrkB/YihY/UPF0761 family membrane protein
MNKKILAIVLAVAVVGLYLFMVLYTSSGFNFIPYLIHEAISPGGAGETNFIIVFDVLFAILLFWLAYKLFDRVLKEKK